jgi:hypothetical protein
MCCASDERLENLAELLESTVSLWPPEFRIPVDDAGAVIPVQTHFRQIGQRVDTAGKLTGKSAPMHHADVVGFRKGVERDLPVAVKFGAMRKTVAHLAVR